MNPKYAKRSINALGELGITDYAIVAMTDGRALVVDSTVLHYRFGPREKLPLANKKFASYEEAMTAILVDKGYTSLAQVDYCLRCHSSTKRVIDKFCCGCAQVPLVFPLSETIVRSDILVTAVPVERLPEYWISFSIPTDVAVCPKCGAALVVEEITEHELLASSTLYRGLAGAPTESGFSFNCSTEPEVGSTAWQAWWDQHWATPYIDWHPLQETIYKWLEGLAFVGLASTAVFTSLSPLRGVGDEWHLAAGAQSEKIFKDDTGWWARFPGKVDFKLEEVLRDSDLFICTRV